MDRWPDAYRPNPDKTPVQCVKCTSRAVITHQARHPRTEDVYYQYRCLDCGSAWAADEHGGAPEDYIAP